MATVHVTHSIGDLARDMAGIPPKMVREGAKIVRKDGLAGTKLAQRYARGLSGPHGADYWKRITGESVGALAFEYGPHDGGVPVGGGWRHGTPNTELERSLDVIGPRFARDVDAMIDGLFW
jgi:hypothetical protein